MINKNYATLIFRLYLLCILFSFTSWAGAQTLNYYYGNIHAHTCYSDGNKEGSAGSCPTSDYQYAKSSQHFDFLGISEHNHFGAGMTNKADYASGLNEANLQNVDGSFVCLYGMEWGVITTTTTPAAGHVIIYGVNELIGWEAGLYDVYNAKTDYDGLFTKIARYSTGNAFAYLAHPDTADYGRLFRTALNPTYDSAIAGMAIRSGPAFSTDTTYSNPSGSIYESRYKEALSQGYHLGAGLDHDNHYKTFGRMAQSRLVALAPSLTQANIMSAIKNMRTYSSDDWNVKVDFTVNTQPLGSVFSASGSPIISVTVSDGDAETTRKIEVYYGVPGSGNLPTLLTSTASSSSLNFTHSIVDGSTYYYYVHVVQTDYDDIYTSPIWFTRNDVTLPIALLSFTADQKNDGVEIYWKTATERNSDYFILESSLNGADFTTIKKVKASGNSSTLKTYLCSDTITPKNLLSGIIYYRLKQVDFNQRITIYNLLSLNYQLKNVVDEIAIFPTPSENFASIELTSKLDISVKLSLTDMLGKTLVENEQEVRKGRNRVDLQLSGIKNGTYILKIIDLDKTCVYNRLILVNNH